MTRLSFAFENRTAVPVVIDPVALALPPPSPLPPDNLLKVAFAGADVTATLDTFPVGTVAGDLVELHVDDVAQPASAIVAEGNTLKATLSIPGAITGASGIHHVDYRLLTGSGATLKGPSVSFRSDTHSAGGVIRAAPIPDFDFTDGLAMDAAPATLAFVVAAYEGMEPGDSLQGYLDDTPVGAPVTVPDSGPGDAVGFDVPATDVTTEGPLAFAYEIRDRAGNAPVRSAAVIINVIREGVGPLLPPVVTGSDDGLIDYADARIDGGVQVRLPFIPRARADDLVYVSWGGVDHGPYAIANFDNGADDALVVVMPYTQVHQAWAAVSARRDEPMTLTVSYVVLRGSVRMHSPAAEITINLFAPGAEGRMDPDPSTPGHDVLSHAVTVSTGGFYDRFWSGEYEQGGTVRVPTRLGSGGTLFLEDGDVIQAHFGVSALVPLIYDASATDPDAEYVSVPLPASSFNGQTGNVPLTYRISRRYGQTTRQIIAPAWTVRAIPRSQGPGGASALPFPDWVNRVNAISDKEIHLVDACHSMQMSVARYPNYREGDVIRMIITLWDSARIKEYERLLAIGDRANMDLNRIFTIKLADMIPPPEAGTRWPTRIEFWFDVFNRQWGDSIRSSIGSYAVRFTRADYDNLMTYLGTDPEAGFELPN